MPQPYSAEKRVFARNFNMSLEAAAEFLDTRSHLERLVDFGLSKPEPTIAFRR